LAKGTRLVISVSNLKSRSPREEGAIDGIDDRLSADLAAAKESTVETFDSVLATRDPVKLEVDVALSVRI